MKKIFLVVLGLLITAPVWAAPELYKMEKAGFEAAPDQVRVEFNRDIANLTLRDILTRNQDSDIIIFEFLNCLTPRSLETIPVSSPEVTRMVYSQYKTNPQVARLVIYLKEPREYKFERSGNFILIKMGPVLKQSPQAVSVTTAAAAPATTYATGSAKPAAISKTNNQPDKVNKTPAKEKVPVVEKKATAPTVAPAIPAVPVSVSQEKKPASTPPETAAKPLPVKARTEKKVQPVPKVIKEIDGQAVEEDPEVWNKLSPELKVKARKIVSIDIKDADLVSVIRLFSKQTGIDVITEDLVIGKVTANFTNIPALDAFDMILNNKGFSWYQRGNVLMVSKERPVKVFHLKYIQVKTLLDNLKGVVAAGSLVDSYPDNNTIIVKGDASDLVLVEDMIHQLDVKPIQVLVDAKIIELTATGEAKLGANLKTAGLSGNYQYEAQSQGLATKPAAEDATTIPEGFFAQAIDSSKGIELYLSALETNTDFTVLASPKILTLNNRLAEIIIGSKIGYKTTTTTGSTTQENVNFLDVGTKLSFTANIGEGSNVIMMKVHPEVSEGEINNVSGLPTKTTTEMTVDVLVRDGQSLVIGGLNRELVSRRDSGIPVLRSLPVIGALFRNTDAKTEKRQLLIFLTPKIIDVERMPDVTREIKDAQERQQNLKDNKSWILP